MEVFNYDWVITHSTIFHADDVFGVAMCRLINPNIEIIRTLDVDSVLKRADAVAKKALVFDIGFGKYDHHQPDKALRTDGTPYCGFGLLWRDFGWMLCPDKDAWNKVDQSLVLPIDKNDNGVAGNLLSGAIGTMNPNWNSNDSEDICFHRAMNIAKSILKAYVDHANSIVAAKDEVLASYDGSEVMVLNKYLPWHDVVINDSKLKDILFVVFPSSRGGWNVQTVPKEIGSFDNRLSFPESWLGHEDPDRGITFAHTANFLIACETKEQAINVAKEAVECGKSEIGNVYSI